MVPSLLVIGDDLPFRLDNVRSGRTGDPLPSATCTYQLLDKESRVEVASGSVLLIDDDDETVSSFEAVVASTHLDLFDAEDNPDGIVPGKEYALRTTVNNAGVKTTKAAILRAVLDPQDQP